MGRGVPRFSGFFLMQQVRSDLRDCAPDLEAFGLVVSAGVLALLIPGQLQLLWV